MNLYVKVCLSWTFKNTDESCISHQFTILVNGLIKTSVYTQKKIFTAHAYKILQQAYLLSSQDDKQKRRGIVYTMYILIR